MVSVLLRKVEEGKDRVAPMLVLLTSLVAASQPVPLADGAKTLLRKDSRYLLKRQKRGELMACAASAVSQVR
jgi:hypothetical protein